MQNDADEQNEDAIEKYKNEMERKMLCLYIVISWNILKSIRGNGYNVHDESKCLKQHKEI